MKNNEHWVANLLLGMAAAMLTASEATAETCSGQWLPSGMPGAVGAVYATTIWDPDGTGPQPPVTVVAGGFVQLANTMARSVAAWDGKAWSPLGQGFDNGAVHAVTTYNGELIAGGSFTSSAGTPLNRVARWNGRSWQPIGSGINGVVRAFAVYDGHLIASGETSGLYRWDGQSWLLFASTGDTVRAMTVWDGKLIVGGNFSSIAGVNANRIASWDGWSWQPLGTGATNPLAASVHALLEHDGHLIAAGNFSAMGGQQCNHVARWDGQVWSPLHMGTNPWVNCLATYQGSLIAGGVFHDINGGNGTNARFVARWNGTVWEPMNSFTSSSGTNDGVHTLIEAPDGSLLAGGIFLQFAQKGAMAMARYDGQNWHAIATGFNAPIEAFTTFQGELYAGGGFITHDGTANIARWNGLTWKPVGEGLNGPVRTLVVHNGHLYAGGVFTASGSQVVNRIARWDGQSWHGLGNGIHTFGEVLALAEYAGDLVVGGIFAFAGSVNAAHIARWDGASWHALGAGTNHHAYALASYNGELYAGGRFTSAGGVSASRIARWNGQQWAPVGSGVAGGDPRVRALHVFQGDLIVGGLFTSAGGLPASRVARWNGQWGNFGNFFTGEPFRFATYNSRLFVGATVPIMLCEWNGDQWIWLGSGFMPNGDMAYIPALEEFQGELNVGGFFQSIAGQSSGYFARFTDSGLPWLAGQPLPLNATCVGAAEFAVSVAAGYPDPLYQWRKNGKPIANGPTGHGSMIGGATEASLVITNAQPMDAGIYDVIVSNSCGEVVSEPATLIVNRCGDVNGDGVVNVNDLLEVINAWGACPAPPVACPADIAPPPQGDGTVNVNDLLLVINNWG